MPFPFRFKMYNILVLDSISKAEGETFEAPVNFPFGGSDLGGHYHSCLANKLPFSLIKSALSANERNILIRFDSV